MALKLFIFDSNIDKSSAQKMEFSIKDFCSKYDQIRRSAIWSHLLQKSLMENFVFYEVYKLSIILWAVSLCRY